MATQQEIETKVRPMTLEDLDAIFLVDHRIRSIGKAITYANLTTEHLFTIDRKVTHLTRPVSYVDLISGDVTELLALGLVAEVEGHVRGFILGRVVPVGEAATKVGEVLILGVHPDYWRKGIATKLVSIISEKFRAKGIRTARIEIDRRDTEMLRFFERMGFTVGQRIEYSKTL